MTVPRNLRDKPTKNVNTIVNKTGRKTAAIPVRGNERYAARQLEGNDLAAMFHREPRCFLMANMGESEGA